ncbi:MAG: TRAP transporter small permease subunit [Paracoccaceae bacterium]
MSGNGGTPMTQSGMARMLQKLRRGAAVVAGFAMLAMMLTGALDVIGTNVFALPIPAAFEFMATMMVLVIFFSVALAQAQRSHIRVGVFTDNLPKPLRKLTDILQFLLSLVFFGLVAWFGWKSGIRSFEVGEYVSGAVNFPIWPARFALAVGATLMVLQNIYDLVACVLGRDDATETERAVERDTQIP